MANPHSSASAERNLDNRDQPERNQLHDDSASVAAQRIHGPGHCVDRLWLDAWLDQRTAGRILDWIHCSADGDRTVHRFAARYIVRPSPMVALIAARDTTGLRAAQRFVAPYDWPASHGSYGGYTGG